MKKIFKDRKTLTLSLCLIIVCVFTLTVAYSALSVVLTINGNAQVAAANWDIHLSNPKVKSGSVTTNVPVIKTSRTLEFETTLNMPGDFYEFVVDVVNAGDIDAMIENVVKTPDLTAEQAKFLKYEVSYQNGEAITTKQLLAKDTTMPIKVRIEYRKDLSNTDLPTGQVVLDLALTLEYVQSDGSGSSVNNNGVQVVSANGDINEIGTIVTIGTEQFYTIGTEGENVKLLSMMNITLDNNPVQSEDAGSSPYSIDNGEHVDYSYYENSKVKEYVDNYKNHLELCGISLVEARLLEYDEYEFFDCASWVGTCTNKYSWLYATSYWFGYDNGYGDVYIILNDGTIRYQSPFFNDNGEGVRPVIVISKDYFN